MALITAGYWASAYWADGYTHDEYWPDSATVVSTPRIRRGLLLGVY